MLVALAVAVPVAAMAACPNVAVAAAVSSGPEVIADQPGVTGPVQPGTATPPPPPPVAPAEPETPVAPPATAYAVQAPEVRNGSRPRPAPEAGPVEPVQWGDLHLPEPVAPVAPIEAPDNTIRLGQWEKPAPPWLPPEARDCVNDTAAAVEAQIATALDSVGLPAGRSDRVSGATLGGAALGAAVGATAAGVPAAAVGAIAGGLIGGTVGGIGGALVGTLVQVPVIGTVTSGVAGTALGAAAGAAAGAVIAGAPAAIAGAVAAGTVGAGFGAGVGVGQP
ncbi:hypothetical protein [Nocardia wallacei]|uniref:hypothetical protein n=1 Tax=Nocardia wallacei TaxID=480035 RepID=UPI0024582DC8|nr:hypothetical protein [Nocardia wallacei]